MRGILFAILGGAFITFQGVANARISQDLGTWQAAALTQCTGFVAALLILLAFKDGHPRQFKRVKPLYLAGGSFAAIVIFSNVNAIELIGVTFSTSSVLMAQLLVTFLIDSFGWFGIPKKQMKLPQFLGIGMMIAGVVVMGWR